MLETGRGEGLEGKGKDADEKVADFGGVAEADFAFGGMDVDVDKGG